MNYYEEIVGEGNVVHSFYTARNECIRCIEIASQRSFLATGLDPSQLLRAPARPPAENGNVPHAAGYSSDYLGTMFGLDGSLDEHGSARICPANSFAKLILPFTACSSLSPSGCRRILASFRENGDRKTATHLLDCCLLLLWSAHGSGLEPPIPAQNITGLDKLAGSDVEVYMSLLEVSDAAAWENS